MTRCQTAHILIGEAKGLHLAFDTLICITVAAYHLSDWRKHRDKRAPLVSKRSAE